MTFPTPEQVANGHGHHLPITGAHTVGAPDGGPGMRLTGWSADHGDIRIAHFAGLHSMTVLTLLGWRLRKSRWAPNKQLETIFVAAGFCAAGFALAFWQALRGQPLFRPDPTIWAAMTVWLAGSALALAFVLLRHPEDDVAAIPMQVPR